MAPRVTLGYTADARVHRNSGVSESFWCTSGGTGARGRALTRGHQRDARGMRGVALAHQRATRTSAGNQATSGKWHRFRLVAPVCGCHLSVAVPVCGRDAGNGTAREKGGRCAVRWGCARLGCARGLGVQLAGCAGDARVTLGYTADVRVHRNSGVSECFWCTAVAERLQSAGTSGKSASGMRAGLREAAKCRNAEMPKCR